jgi:hypothetical protein
MRCRFFNNNVTMKAKIFIISIILVGCYPSFYVDEMYEGPKRPISEVSVLIGIAPTFLWEIDGEEHPRSNKGYNCCDFLYGRFSLGLEPGIHDLVAQYYKVEVAMGHFIDKGNLYDTRYSFESDDLTKLVYTFEPGKIYKLKATKDSVWIIEVKNLPKHLLDFYSDI